MSASGSLRLEELLLSKKPGHPKEEDRATLSASMDPKRMRPNALCLPPVEQMSLKTLNRIRKPVETNLSSRAAAVLIFTELSASLTRAVLKMVPSIGPKHPSISGLGWVSSGIGLVRGTAKTMRNGAVDLKKSEQIGDGEGRRHAATQTVSGAIATNASLFSLAHQAAASTFATSFRIAANVFFGLGSVVDVSISGLGIYRSASFLSQINRHQKSINLNEKERVIKTLEFLKEKIAPTDKEKETIIKDVEKMYPHWNLQDKAAASKRKILDLAEVKFRYIQRRTGQKTAERILIEIPQLLNRKSNSHHLDSAKKLISDVKIQTKKEILITALMSFASLIAFAFLIVGTFFSFLRFLIVFLK